MKTVWLVLGNNKDQITVVVATIVVIVGIIEFYHAKDEQALDRALKQSSIFEQSEVSNIELNLSSVTASKEFIDNMPKTSNYLTPSKKREIWVGYFYSSVLLSAKESSFSSYPVNLTKESKVIRLLNYYRNIAICANSGACDRQLVCKQFAVRMDHIRCQLKHLFLYYSNRWGICLSDDIDELLDIRCKSQMAALHAKPGVPYRNIASNRCFRDLEGLPRICKSYERAQPKNYPLLSENVP